MEQDSFTRSPQTGITRREALRLGSLGVISAVVAACTSDADSSSDAALAASPASESLASEAEAAVSGELAALTVADFAAVGACRLAPEQTPGPFPLDEQFDRRDVTGGVPGHPTRLGFRVIDVSCSPVSNAKVEVWHADATGDYSAFVDGGNGKDEGPGTTFLRGTQPTNADGIAEFHTIYPGWYSGRAVHIHLRVHINDRIVLTSQVYFDDTYSAKVYQAEPYLQNGPPDTPTESDRIAGDAAADGTVMSTVEGPTLRGAGTVALINLAIDPSAVSR